MSNNSSLKKFWDTMEEVVFLPKFIFIFLPVLVFISLFFIPEGYSGLIAIAKNMDGTYQNRWLYDMSFISVLIVFLHIHINAFFNSSYPQNRYKLTQYLKPKKNQPDTHNTDGSAKYLRIFYYLMFVVYLINMNTGAINGSSRWQPEYNRFVFFNFFVQFLFYYVFLLCGLFLFFTKEDLDKGKEIYFKEDK